MCGGDLAGIQSLIENQGADEWSRIAGLSSLVTLVAAGQKSRDEIVSYFAHLFHGKLTRQRSPVWGSLVSCCADLYPAELLADIRQAYEEGLVDPGYIRLENVERDLEVGKDRLLARLANNPDLRLVEDTVAEMGSWACFREEKETRSQAATRSPANLNSTPAAGPPQLKKAGPKTGRNEPCPCGSGKKYKKCCGA